MMPRKKKFKNVYQFRITLMDIKPEIWRIIQVPESYTFWDFHCGIQDSMGWTDSHLHEFNMKEPHHKNVGRIGIYEDEFDGDDFMFFDWEEDISFWFHMENPFARYFYDFGDSWEHVIELEKILPADKNVKYPVCVAGENACPPEDCGGTPGYESFLKIMRDPDDEEHEEMVTWAGGTFDPKKFDPGKVKFTNPAKRLKYVMEG